MIQNEWHQVAAQEGCRAKAEGADKEPQEGRQTKQRGECCLEETIGMFGVHSTDSSKAPRMTAEGKTLRKTSRRQDLFGGIKEQEVWSRTTAYLGVCSTKPRGDKMLAVRKKAVK